MDAAVLDTGTLPGRGALRIFDIVPRATFREDNPGHYMMIKKSILQEDIINFKVYVPNSRVSNYMRKKKKKEEEGRIARRNR